MLRRIIARASSQWSKRQVNHTDLHPERGCPNENVTRTHPTVLTAVLSRVMPRQNAPGGTFNRIPQVTAGRRCANEVRPFE